MTDLRASSLVENFAKWEDPRIERTKFHQLRDILVTTVCAVICGADNWVEIEEFGRARQAWLGQMLGLSKGIPSHFEKAKAESAKAMLNITSLAYAVWP